MPPSPAEPATSDPPRGHRRPAYADASVATTRIPPRRAARHNSPVPLSRISWLVTVGLCLIVALLLLVNGYVGYFAVLLAVAPRLG